MITELEIEGFKSFGSPGVKVSLERLNFIVGQNASGKTNFISALRFLQNCVRHNVEYAVSELGGSAEVRNKRQRQRKHEKYLRIRLRVDWPFEYPAPSTPQRVRGESFDYVLVIDLRAEDEKPIVVEERLLATLRAGTETADYALRRDKDHVVLCDPFSGTRDGPAERELPVPPQELARPAVSVGFFSFPAVVFREIINLWSFYNIAPQIARQPYKDAPDAALGPSGENLAVMLHTIEKAGPSNGMRALVAALRGAVPDLRDLDTMRDGIEGKLALRVHEEGIRSPILPPSISDGTVRLIALLAIGMVGHEPGGLIAIEEPENSIHPHVTEHLVTVFRERSKRSQIIITTHNPTFLDYVEPREVVLCGKVNGFTVMRRASDLAEIGKFAKRFTLGDLWVQGTFDQLFEGTP